MHSVYAYSSRRRVLPRLADILAAATSTAPEASLSEQLKEKVYTSGFASAECVLAEESQVVQTKGEKHFGITTSDFSLHSCFTAVMNNFQAVVILHKAEDESALTALVQSLYCKTSRRRPELLHSLWKMKASVQISVQTANGCSERSHLECDPGLT